MDSRQLRYKKQTFQKLQLMGLTDIAKELKWTNSKVKIYMDRGVLPGPIGEVGGRPVWLRDQLEPYFAKHKTKERA